MPHSPKVARSAERRPSSNAPTLLREEPALLEPAASRIAGDVGSATYSKEIQAAIAFLCNKFKLNVDISCNEEDKPVIEEVMNIYLAEGETWPNKAKLDLVKVLPMIKITHSSRVIISNHTIWRRVFRQNEGWNWAYWIAFRATYGIKLLQSRRNVVSSVEKVFPGTDIWIAKTPAASSSSSFSGTNGTRKVYPATPITNPKNSSSNPTSNKRKLAGHDLKEESSRKIKRRISHNPSNSTLLGAKQNTRAPKEEGDQSDGSETIADCITVATRTLIAIADDRPAPQTDGTTAKSPKNAQVVTDDAISANDTRSAGAFETTETVAVPIQSPHDEEIEDRSERDRSEEDKLNQMCERIKRELRHEYNGHISRINERVERQSVLVGYVVQVFENIIEIKNRLDRLEEANKEARMRTATTYNLPSQSGGVGQNLHRTIEALGQQVEFCTRSIQELKKGRSVEDDPVLLNIKREPIQLLASDVGHDGTRTGERTRAIRKQ
ncbi:hypothetical protein BGZ63DRAFT_403433 [Mariannaea sp. PMI_226]|nr:hypothetical protein BGZ63DRAFT_403433 [Mariannaea sp. PMI_226]